MDSVLVSTDQPKKHQWIDLIPWSVLCVPVSRQNKVVAIAYFENNLASGIFNENRVSLATMLASQAAISIQNAMLYDNMEMLVKE